jgi:hypothetical protein
MDQPRALDPWPHLEEDDPPLDLTRENAAYAKERERLLREHRGKIALIVGDEVVGVFAGVDEAMLEGCRRFGDVRMVSRLIEEDNGPEYISNVDINHPSVRRID